CDRTCLRAHAGAFDRAPHLAGAGSVFHWRCVSPSATNPLSGTTSTRMRQPQHGHRDAPPRRGAVRGARRAHHSSTFCAASRRLHTQERRRNDFRNLRRIVMSDVRDRGAVVFGNLLGEENETRLRDEMRAATRTFGALTADFATDFAFGTI